MKCGQQNIAHFINVEEHVTAPTSEYDDEQQPPVQCPRLQQAVNARVAGALGERINLLGAVGTMVN